MANAALPRQRFKSRDFREYSYRHLVHLPAYRSHPEFLQWNDDGNRNCLSPSVCRDWLSGMDHMFLNFERRAQSEDDGTVDVFGPTGLSGGPLLDLGDFFSEEAYSTETTHRASLSGILIEHHPKHKAMVAVKIGSIVAGIRKSLE